MNITKSCPLCGCLLKEIVILDIEFVVRGKSAEDIHNKWNAKFKRHNE